MKKKEWYKLPLRMSVPTDDEEAIANFKKMQEQLKEKGCTYLEGKFPHNFIELREYISEYSKKLPIEVIFKFLLLSPQQFVAMLNSDDDDYRLVTEKEDDFLKAREKGEKYFFTRENVFRGLEENYYFLDYDYPMICHNEEVYDERTLLVDYRDFFHWCDHNYELLEEYASQETTALREKEIAKDNEEFMAEWEKKWGECFKDTLPNDPAPVDIEQADPDTLRKEIAKLKEENSQLQAKIDAQGAELWGVPAYIMRRKLEGATSEQVAQELKAKGLSYPAVGALMHPKGDLADYKQYAVGLIKGENKKKPW